MDQIKRKLMTMHKPLHPRDDVNRLCVKKRRKKRTYLKIVFDVLIQWFGDYTEKHGGKLINDNTKVKRTRITRKQKWEEKQLYRHFKWQTSDISQEKTWMWLRKGNLKRETESLLIASQNNTIRTNYINARIDKTRQNS